MPGGRPVDRSEQGRRGERRLVKWEERSSHIAYYAISRSPPIKSRAVDKLSYKWTSIVYTEHRAMRLANTKADQILFFDYSRKAGFADEYS